MADVPVDTGTVSAVIGGVVALYVLVWAAGVAVTLSTALAQRFDVPEVLIGMTVIAVGTSLPEIGSHVVASLGIASGTLDYRVASATVLGGNMGSSATQQLLLFGVFLIGFGRYELTPLFVRGSYLVMVLATGLTLLVVADGTVSELDGLVLVGAFVWYVIVSYRTRERTMRVR